MNEPPIPYFTLLRRNLLKMFTRKTTVPTTFPANKKHRSPSKALYV